MEPQPCESERASKLCFSRKQAVLVASKCWQELRAALPSPCTMHDSHRSLFSPSRPSPPSRVKESPACSWCSCFKPRKPSSVGKRQLQRDAREPSETEVVVLAGKGAHPAVKTLLVSAIDFMLAVGLFLLLAFKLSFFPKSGVSGEVKMWTCWSTPLSCLSPSTFGKRQEMGTTAVCLRMIPSDT